jgi:hypothetical protein
VTRRPIGPQAAAVLASLSINAFLFLGLRQVGSLSEDATEDDAAPLLVLDLRADDPSPRTRARPERRTRASSPAARKRPPVANASSTALAVAPTPAAPATPIAAATDDRWDMPGDPAPRSSFPSTFQRSMSGEPAPRLERRAVLAGLEFHDGSFAGFLARFGRMLDCGELQSALGHHPESAQAIAQTMARLGCHER